MRPAVIIAHGSWHAPEHYQEVVDYLQHNGLEDVHCPQLPSQTSTITAPSTANLEHDTIVLRETIQPLVDQGRYVIVLMHSYGGIAGGNSLDGFLPPQRTAPKQKGGVVHLVYMAAFCLPLGSSVSDPFGGKTAPWLKEDVDNGVIHMIDPRHTFYSHIESDAEAQKWLDKMVYCATVISREPQNFVPYDYIGAGVDATYLVCERDKSLSVPAQEEMASLLGDSRRMEYCDAGHCCMIGYGETIAKVVDRAWRVSELRLSGN